MNEKYATLAKVNELVGGVDLSSCSLVNPLEPKPGDIKVIDKNIYIYDGATENLSSPELNGWQLMNSWQ